MIDAKTAHENLAFMRTVLDERSAGMRSGGLLYGAAGVLYGLQCSFQWLHAAEILPLHPVLSLVVGLLPTVVFLGLCGYVFWRERKSLTLKGAASRAVAAAFGGAGIANGVLALVFAMAAAARDDMTIWMFFPVVVCALQGAVWYTVAMVQRRWWMGAVAGGWYGTALILGLTVSSPATYLAVLGMAMFAFMAVPGFILIRLAGTTAAP